MRPTSATAEAITIPNEMARVASSVAAHGSAPGMATSAVHATARAIAILPTAVDCRCLSTPPPGLMGSTASGTWAESSGAPIHPTVSSVNLEPPSVLATGRVAPRATMRAAHAPGQESRRNAAPSRLPLPTLPLIRTRWRASTDADPGTRVLPDRGRHDPDQPVVRIRARGLPHRPLAGPRRDRTAGEGRRRGRRHRLREDLSGVFVEEPGGRRGLPVLRLPVRRHPVRRIGD